MGGLAQELNSPEIRAAFQPGLYSDGDDGLFQDTPGLIVVTKADGTCRITVACFNGKIIIYPGNLGRNIRLDMADPDSIDKVVVCVKTLYSL